MPPPRISDSLTAQIRRLSLDPSRPRNSSSHNTIPVFTSCRRAFSSTPRPLNWLAPKSGETRKSRKGRCHVPIGGSTRGTTVVWGDYGLRMRSHDRRISATQLRIAEETIKKRLRGMKFRLYERVSANIGVYTSGNENRMGKGKGTFDHWAVRLGVSKVVFEIKGELHEQVVKDAFRLAGNKLPGLWEFVKKGDAPKIGITKVGMDGITEADLKRPRMKIGVEETAARLPSASQL